MLTLRRRGCSTLEPPLRQRANPHRGKTTNRRAGCGRTARPVRREGEPKPIGPPYPYKRIAAAQGRGIRSTALTTAIYVRARTASGRDCLRVAI
jgi:hypothetical protein